MTMTAVTFMNSHLRVHNSKKKKKLQIVENTMVLVDKRWD